MVYCASVSILRYCFLRSRGERLGNGFVGVGVYPDEIEQLRISDSIKKYAQAFGGRCIVGSQATEDEFRIAAEAASIIHFHGHAGQNEYGSVLDKRCSYLP